MPEQADRGLRRFPFRLHAAALQIRGDIVLAELPYSDGSGSKKRPALVVQCDRNNRRLDNVILAMITSSTGTMRLQRELTGVRSRIIVTSVESGMACET